MRTHPLTPSPPSPPPSPSPPSLTSAHVAENSMTHGLASHDTCRPSPCPSTDAYTRGPPGSLTVFSPLFPVRLQMRSKSARMSFSNLWYRYGYGIGVEVRFGLGLG